MPQAQDAKAVKTKATLKKAADEVSAKEAKAVKAIEKLEAKETKAAPKK